MGEIEVTARALDARISEIMLSRINREAIVKTFVLNQYAMMALGCGFVLAPRELNELSVKFFDEIVLEHPKTARPHVVSIRKNLLKDYPFWIPNRFHLALELAQMGKAFESEARDAFLNALPLVQNMVIDSDHYAQLWIDCRHYPLSEKRHQWPPTNQMPWFVVKNMLDACRKFIPESVDAPRLIHRLLLK